MKPVTLALALGATAVIAAATFTFHPRSATGVLAAHGVREAAPPLPVTADARPLANEPLAELERRARAGEAAALRELAHRHATGRGVPRDPDKAARLYLQAAEQGDAEALYRLGLAYRQGEGVSRNDVAAFMLFDLAAARGHEAARLEKYRLGSRLTRRQIEKAARLASSWMPELQAGATATREAAVSP